MQKPIFMAAIATMLFWSAFYALAGQGSGVPPDPRVVHVVLIWLEEPGNEQHRQRIIQATREFAHLPGVDQIRVGMPIASDRSSVDDSFDVGLYMTFESTSALDSYLKNPTHKEAQKSILAPLVKRVLVYDFFDDGS